MKLQIDHNSKLPLNVQVEELVRKLIASGIGFAVPGPFNYEEGICLMIPHEKELNSGYLTMIHLLQENH